MNLQTLNLRHIIGACVLTGAVIATGIAFAIPDRYVSTAVLRVGQGVDPGSIGTYVNAACDVVLRKGSLAELIQKENLYAKDRLSRPLEDVVEHMRNESIRVSNKSNPRVLTVQFTSGNAAEAQRIAANLTARFLEAVPKGNFEVIDPANLPNGPFSPSRWRVTTAGGLVGLVLAGVLGGLRRLMRSKT